MYKNSPFLYHSEMQLVTDCTKKTNTSFPEMAKFVSKKLVSSEDMAILDALYQYQILNRHILEQLLLSEQSTRNFKRRLHKLLELGIVKRFAFSYQDAEKERQTPYFYSLTSGAHNFVKRYSPDKQELFNAEIVKEKVCEILSLNQFDVFFTKFYNARIKEKIKYRYIPISKGNKLLLDLSYHLNWKNENGWHNLMLVVVPVRRYTDWKDALQKKVSELVEYSEKTDSLIPCPILLFLAESDEHIKAIHELLAGINFKECTVLYTTDILTARFPICEYLYSCDDTDSGIILNVKKLIF